MEKERKEAVRLLAKGLRIIEKLEGMSLEEKRKMKRSDETCEQYVERMEEVQVNAIEVAVKSIIER